jgi:hypothetical protein
MTDIVFHRAGKGLPEKILAGQTVTAEMPANCRLIVSTGGEWSVVSSPYFAATDCMVRVECVTYEGTPVAVTMTVTEAG